MICLTASAGYDYAHDQFHADMYGPDANYWQAQIEYFAGVLWANNC